MHHLSFRQRLPLSPGDLGDLAQLEQLQPVACIIHPAFTMESESASQQFPFKAHLFRFLKKILKHCMYPHVHSSIIHNSQKVEAIQVSTDG